MGEYAGSSSCFKPCLPSMAMEYGMDLMTSQLEECTMEIPSLELMSYFDEDYLSIYVSSPDERLFASPVLPVPVASSDAELSREEGRKRKSMEVHDLTGNGRFSESELTETKISENKNSSRNGKRARDISKEADKQTEVVHVRARRGQATDSHSLAERSRRERIKERMRVLQDLVPGCHKSKGMTGMLDEIINYVRSLQNQVEFLSLTLSAACSVYEHHCFDVEVTAAPQGGDGLLVSRDDCGGCNSLSSIMPL